MKSLLAPTVFSLVSVIGIAQSHAVEIEIFGLDDNGGFDMLDPSNTPIQNGGTRRAAADGGTYFVHNWLITPTSGFGGVDQHGLQPGNAGILSNDGATTTGIAFVNSGSIDVGPDLVPGTEDDIVNDPSGAFNLDGAGGGIVPAGSQINFSFDASDNQPGGTFDWEIALLLDGEADLANRVTLGAGTFTSPDPIETLSVSGSGILTTDATTFNLVAILDNSNGGNDQVHGDNFVLTYDPELPLLVPGDVQIDGLRDGAVNLADFEEIAAEFGNTGMGVIDGDAVGGTNGSVGLDDFLAWKSAFEIANGGGAAVAGATGVAIPEPASALTLLIGMACGLTAVRRVA